MTDKSLIKDKTYSKEQDEFEMGIYNNNNNNLDLFIRISEDMKFKLQPPVSSNTVE